MFLLSYDITAHCVSDYDSHFIGHGGEDSHTEKADATKGFVMPISSGPAPLYSMAQGRAELMNMINGATRSLYITTPYLIIDYGLTEALKCAAARGVDVRIITPGIPDKRIISVMTKSSYATLCASGVRIFEYTPGFMHSKLAIADGTSALVGSINLDYRSLAHHFEDALAIYSESTVEQITNDFFATLAKCTEANASALTLRGRILCSLMRIIAPLL
jgi:cardiolipin synthase